MSVLRIEGRNSSIMASELQVERRQRDSKYCRTECDQGVMVKSWVANGSMGLEEENGEGIWS